MEYTEKVAWLRRYRESLRQEQLLGEEIGPAGIPGPAGHPGHLGNARRGRGRPAIPGRWSGWKKPARSWPGCWNRIRPSGPRSPAAIQKEVIPLRRDILTRRYIWDSGGRRSPPPITWCCGQVFRLHHQAVDGLDL